MSVKYSWSRQNGAAVPPVRFMSIEPAENYYKGMPLKLKEKGIVEPTDGDPEYICMAEYNPGAEIQPLEIPVQEVFPDVVYDRMNDDGTIEEVRFGSKGGSNGDLLETVETEVPLVITFDGDLTGKETANGDGFVSAKVSDIVLSVEDVIGATIVDSVNGEDIITVVSAEQVEDLSAMGFPIIAVMTQYSQIQIITADISQGDLSMTAGVWFVKGVAAGNEIYVKSFTCPNATTTTTKTQLKPSLLPEHRHNGLPWSITWDGNLEGKETIIDGDNTFVKLSNITPSMEEFIGAGLTVHVPYDNIRYEAPVLREDIDDMSAMGLPGYLIKTEGMLYVFLEDASNGTFTFPAGIWMMAPILEDGSLDFILEKITIRPTHSYILLKSTTEGSEKKFRVTVDDTGELITEEV